RVARSACLWAVPVLREDLVDATPGLIEDCDGPFDLVGRAGCGDLRDRLTQERPRLGDGAETSQIRARRELPGGAPTAVLQTLGLRPAGLRERIRLATGVLLDGEQPLVGQQLEGRVDRSGTGLPGAVGSLLDLPDDLVAVHRLLGEQVDDGCPHVAAVGAATAGVAVSSA